MADVGVPTTGEQGLTDADRADEAAEHHLVHRVIIGMVIAIPIFVVVFGLLVGLSVRSAGAPAGVPFAMGVGIGVLAGIFFGIWGGIVASVREVEDAEHDAEVTRAEEVRASARHEDVGETSSPPDQPEEFPVSPGVVPDDPVE